MGSKMLVVPSLVGALLAAIGAAATGDDVAPRPLELELPGEPAAFYRTGEPLAEGDTAVAAALRRRHPALAFSSNLACAARELGAGWSASGLQSAPQELIAFLLHSCGCPDAGALAALVATTGDSDGEVWEQLAALLKAVGEPYTHVGIARVADPTGRFRWRWVTLLTTRRLSLAPLARRLEPGDTLRLRFALDRGLHDPTVIVMAPGSATRRSAPRSLAGAWEAVLALSEKGEHVVEVLADDERGPQVVALFPVTVGQAPPRRWRGEQAPAERWMGGAADAERYLADLTDRRRVEAGRRELVWDTDLAVIARAHSQDMRDHGFMGHVSPTTGELGDRLRRAGYAFSYASENIARSSSVWEAMESLMASPGHRRNILSSAATHGGIGVAIATGRDGARTYIVTQVFVQPRTVSSSRQ